MQQLNSLKREGTFARNFAFAFSGNVVSLVLQVLVSPLMTRLYTPEAYGLFAVFNSFVLNYFLISSLSYANAILASTRRNVVYSLVALSVFISGVSFVVGMMLIYLFAEPIQNLFNLHSLGGWIYFIPLSAFLIAINMVLSSYNVFHNRVKEDSAIVISTTVFNRSFNLLFGFFMAGNFTGLLLGDILGKLGRCGLLFRGISKRLRFFFSKKAFIRVGKEYKNYPYFILPSALLNLISNSIPIYLFSIYFSITEVGYFSFAANLLYIPVQLLGHSSASIFFKKASDIYHANGIGNLKDITVKLYWNFLGSGLLGYSALMMFGSGLFTFVFGDPWATSGEYAAHLAIYHIFLLMFTPLNAIFSVLQKEKLLLMANVVVFLTRVISLYGGIFYGDALFTVKIFSWVNMACFLMLSLLVLKIVGASFAKHFMLTIIILAFALLISYSVPNFVF